MKMMVPSGLDLVEANPSAEARVSDTLTESHARSVAGPSKQLLLTFVNRIRLDFARHRLRTLTPTPTLTLTLTPTLTLTLTVTRPSRGRRTCASSGSPTGWSAQPTSARCAACGARACRALA